MVTCQERMHTAVLSTQRHDTATWYLACASAVGFRSGCSCRASLRKAALTSCLLAAASRPRASRCCFLLLDIQDHCQHGSAGIDLVAMGCLGRSWSLHSS